MESIYDSQFEDNIAPGERGSNEAVTKVAEDINRPVKVKTSNQLRIGSYFSLANTIGTSGAPHSAIVTEEQGEEQDLREHEGDDRPVGNIEKKGALLVAHQIMHDLGSNRLTKPTTNKIKRSTVRDLFRRVMAAPPNAILDGGLKVAVEMYRELKLSSELLMSNLENSGRCIERFAFYEESFRGVVIGSINADRYLKSCFKNAEEAIRNYTDYARITYPESWKKSSLVQTLRGSLTSPHFQELWEKVDASMNELDRTISLQLMLEQRERTETSITAHRRLEETAINTYLSQQEVLQVHGNLELKVEATHLLVVMAMSKMEGKRRGTHRKRQKSRRNGAEGDTSKVAKPGKDGTENIKAESGRELGYEAPLGNSEKSFHPSVEDWETSNEEES
ncbi:uncharacterized protein K444DRAFT_608298 [Hyaloscypha bicolor E]|uniref:Uncharacterized protein n=1 Tax=Hyaloscypha bicolor E TaxID=1095630 RepID=A0A2J6TRT0_9HELO|nr:uncharacterized protein K444DRAFT_608298 [Hyaloscypha bicolor E]PMD65723.1 hypothetical protein K444DRAFT_608298 [Hyaloscypha bicolor E]